MRKIKILAVTGIRSEYDVFYPILDTLRDNDAFDVKLVVSGAHNSDWHGWTIKKIREDGFSIADQLDSLFMTNRRTQRPKGVGILAYALSQTIEREKPDFLLVIGDREESIATAIVGNYMDILVAHIGGGDTAYGNADDPIRFAVSKLAHIHLAMAKHHAKNLKRIGEEKFRIFNVGNPSLDNIRQTKVIPLKELARLLDFDITNKKYVVLIQHPLSSEAEDAYSQMVTTLNALEIFCQKTEFKVIAIYPNTDPGSYDIIKAIHMFEGKPFINFYKSLPRDLFVNLMRNARALIGNSSMGILEAPFYKLPVVNVGNRQKGRQHAGNVIFVRHSVPAIQKALAKASFDDVFRNHIVHLKNPYGDGKTSDRIKKILLSLDFKDRKWYIKKKFC